MKFGRFPQCLHFPNKFEWSPVWILPKFSAILPLVLLKIKWCPLKSHPPPSYFLRVSGLSLFAFCFCFLIARAVIERTLRHIQGELYKWGLYLTIILDCYWGHWATKPDFRFITKSIGFDFPWIYSFNFAMIQTIKYNGKILNVKPNAGTVQGRYSIIFKRLVTDRQHTCNSVDKWVSIAFRLPQLHYYMPSWLNFYLFHLQHFTEHCCLLWALRILIWDMYISIPNVTVKSHNKTV